MCDGLYEQSLGNGLNTLVLWNNQITYQSMPSLARSLVSSLHVLCIYCTCVSFLLIFIDTESGLTSSIVQFVSCFVGIFNLVGTYVVHITCGQCRIYVKLIKVLNIFFADVNKEYRDVESWA